MKREERKHMSTLNPDTTLDSDFSGDLPAISWAVGGKLLVEAGIYWLSSVRPDGQPHVKPVIGVWFDNAMHFFTGPNDRKTRNLAKNTDVVITTGVNTYAGGTDIVIDP